MKLQFVANDEIAYKAIFHIVSFVLALKIHEKFRLNNLLHYPPLGHAEVLP